MKLRLWGTRGSIPSPLRTRDIETKIRAALSAAAEAAVDLSDPAAVRAFVASLPYAIRGTAGGDTACLEVRSGGNLFIFDCGSGLRQLGLELMKEEFGRGQGVAHILISHTHWDHMIGWPFFVPAFIPGNRFYIHGLHPDLEERFRLQQTAPNMFPVSLDYQQADINFVLLQEGSTIQIGQTHIRNMRFHHPGDAYGYRVEDDDGILVYASDSEYKTLDPAATQHYVEFFRNAGLLIFDAMFSLRESYQKEDWGHSSAVAGADLATRAGVRRLLLFHHDPAYSDEQIWSLRDIAEAYLEQHPERPPCEVIVAYDGLEMDLWREATLETQLEHLPEGIAIHLCGRLAAETVPVALKALDEAIAGALERAMPVVVDLASVTHVDQEGLKALLSARRHRCPVALSGLSPELQRNFARAGALDYFAVFDTPRSALLAMRQGLELHPGQVLSNRYRIAEGLGANTLGNLYRATDQAIERQVTLQVISPALGLMSTRALITAAQTAINLRHPLIARVYDAGQDGHVQYLILEYTPGRSIRQLLDSDDRPAPLSLTQALSIGLQIAQALEYAHSRNYVHGALTPDNVILAEDDSIKIVGFGIGRLDIDRPLSELPVHVGPLDYMAPEQIRGHGINPGSDLYALGTLLYEILAWTTPFATASDEDLISLQLHQLPVPPRRRNPNLSRSLEHLVLNLLQKSPLERPSDAGFVCQVLAGLNSRACQRPLLGRDTPRHKLWGHLQRVARGQSGLVILHGGRGIGKSCLVSSVASQPMTGHPPTTLHCELFADEDSRPYKLFVEALRCTLLGLPAHQLTQLFNALGDLALPLTALLPDLQPTLSALAAKQVECERLEEAICETLRLMATQGPTVLILDSLQWIDAASLRLFQRLARHKIPRMLTVALYRDDEVGKDHPLQQALDALEPWVDEQLHLTPLVLADVHQMVQARSDLQHVPPDFGFWLFGETNGNPLHVEQLIQAYLEGPSEARQPQEGPTATTLEDVILRRMERLPGGVLATLRQAAVLGHTFSFGMLRAALDQAEQEVLANLDRALQAGFILGHPSEHRYGFSHPVLREVIYSEMLAGVRKRCHQRVARVLERDGPSGVLDEKVDLLAHHLLRAGEGEQALANLARATRRARELCAFETALACVIRALQLVEQLVQAAGGERERAQRQRQRDDLLAARANLEAAIANRDKSSG
jgi:phosphoribosyl 1,2-cyclic phosphodiesterase/anti-anti-sigma regulatory factor